MGRLYRAPRLSVGLAAASLGNYAAIGLAFLTNIQLTRTIGPHEFGRLALLLMASQVATLFVASWTVTGLIRFGAREHATHGVVARAFWDRTLLMAPGVALLGAVVVAFAPLAAEYLAIPVAALLLVAAHFVVSSVLAAGMAVLQATQRISSYGIALALDRAAALVIVLIATRTVALDAVGALVAYGAGTLVAAVWVLATVRRLIFVRVPLDRARLAEFARFSLPIVAGTWAGVLGNQWIDLVIMRQLLPLSDLGMYALAYQIAGAAQQLTTVAGSVLLPRFSALVASGDEAEIHDTLRRVIPGWLLLFAIGLGALIALADLFVPLVFGAGFASATPAVRILLFGGILAALFSVLQALLIARGSTWPVSFAVLAAVIVHSALDLAFIPLMGIAGAAVATVASYAVSAALVVVAAARRGTPHTSRYVLFVAIPAVVAALSVTLEGQVLVLAGVVAVALASAVCALAFDLVPGASADRT